MNIKKLKLSVTNCFLIEAGRKQVLIDTGYEQDWSLFNRRLDEAGVGLPDISHLILTHHHDDHCGLVSRMVQANPEIRIVMSCRAQGALAKGKNDSLRGGGWVSKRVSLLFSLIATIDKRWKNHTFPPYASREKDYLVQRATDLDEVGIRLAGKILETPGHTSDSISVLLKDGTSLVGDAAANMLQFAGTKYCCILVENIEENYRSWRTLISAGAREILPAHGNPFSVEQLGRNMGKITRSNIVPV